MRNEIDDLREQATEQVVGEPDMQSCSPQTTNSPLVPSTPIRRRSSRFFFQSTPRQQWEDVENIIYPFDTDDGETLACFELLRDDGVSCSVLYALASLLGKQKGTPLASASGVGQNDHQCRVLVASFLMGSTAYNVKLSLVELLMVELLPPVGDLEEDELAVQDTLDYLLGRDFGWNQPVHAEIEPFSELRQMCLALKEQAIQAEVYKREAVARIVKGGDMAAGAISGAALAVETGLSWSVPVITGGLDCAGSMIKYVIKSPEKEPPKTKAGVLASVYTDAAKRATDGVRVGTQTAVHGIRDASTKGITTMSEKFEEEKLGEKLVPDKHQRDVLGAAGKVGVASLGAVAIVGEAVVETTSAILKKTASVTSDVVRHKYGDSAGRVVQDASDTTGNVLRTASHVAMLEAKVLTKSVAKNTGKAQIKQNRQNSLEESEEGSKSLRADDMAAKKTIGYQEEDPPDQAKKFHT